jgi:hypothetical protein
MSWIIMLRCQWTADQNAIFAKIIFLIMHFALQFIFPTDQSFKSASFLYAWFTQPALLLLVLTFTVHALHYCTGIFLQSTCVLFFFQSQYQYCPIKMWSLVWQYHYCQVKMGPLASHYHYCQNVATGFTVPVLTSHSVATDLTVPWHLKFPVPRW